MTRSRSASDVATNQSQSVAVAASLPTARVSLESTVDLKSSISSSRTSGSSDAPSRRRLVKSLREMFVGIQSKSYDQDVPDGQWSSLMPRENDRYAPVAKPMPGS